MIHRIDVVEYKEDSFVFVLYGENAPQVVEAQTFLVRNKNAFGQSGIPTLTLDQEKPIEWRFLSYLDNEELSVDLADEILKCPVDHEGDDEAHE